MFVWTGSGRPEHTVEQILNKRVIDGLVVLVEGPIVVLLGLSSHKVSLSNVVFLADLIEVFMQSVDKEREELLGVMLHVVVELGYETDLRSCCTG